MTMGKQLRLPLRPPAATPPAVRRKGAAAVIRIGDKVHLRNAPPPASQAW
jgi:hypothetical protein